ncbi:inactive dipeptidyl peptidase 10-like isoform X1 [Sinocyclocheilus grahami]|uniref:inactive dipeptidyl peptidase 10-like isoform X1 n=2 Tax=Sinocyclocheilus grahami TaxID=75366 RepID=UPI0007AC6B67|nr:PREDICTED: inactive dipeptidyl peptidase 10-like isoform X1 [Sinocyclocheilus grahami]
MNQTAGVSNHCQRRSSIDVKDVGSVSTEMNWKGVGISLLVIAFVLSLIGFSIFLLSKGDAHHTLRSCLTLDDLFSSELQDHDLEAQWVSAQRLVYKDRDGDLKILNMEINQTEVLMKNTTFTEFKASKFVVSPDLKYILLAYDVRKVYRYSYLASYLIYNIQTREVHELNPPEVSDCVLQFASWGNHDQQLVYIFENNIYYQPDVKSSSLRLTSSGRDGLIFNGITDWLYEEQILHSSAAHWWSPSGSSLAFLTINDTLVPNMQLPRFTGTLYPRGHQYPYPKAGQKNPEVTLFVINVNGSTHATQLLHPKSLQRSDLYISMVRWVTDECLAVRWLNRPQNSSILTLCYTHTGKCVPKHVMISDKWIDRQNEKPSFSKDGETFFVTLPLRSGGRGSFRHLTMMSEQPEGEEVSMQHLTSGTWEVTEILSYDQKCNTVYFLSNEAGFSHRHLYRVSTVEPFHRECLSCSVFKPHCSFYEASVSPDRRAVLLNCRGPGIPKTTVHLLSNMSDHVTVDAHLEIREFLQKKQTPVRQIRNLLINNQALRLELSFPPQFEESKRHPLLLLLDSDPGGQQVSECFRLDWTDELVSCEDVIVARLDGRGSGCQGQQILQDVYQRLGLVETEELRSVLQYLMEQPYIDGGRVGVFGKAYGGFLSSILLLSHGSELRCGAAVSPVFDWQLYASAFTERYFGFPLQNELKYKISSFLLNITRSENLRFLILHGTADANVHFQHTAELVKLLSVININYRLQIFPDEGHDVISSRYMLHSLVSFYRDCFIDNLPVPVETSDDD